MFRGRFSRLLLLCGLLWVMATAVATARFGIATVSPQGRIWLQPGDVLTVEVKGTPGVEGSFSIGDHVVDMPLIESTRATYQGVYRIQPDDEFRSARLVVKLQQGDEQVTQKAAYVTVMRCDVPAVLRLTGDPYSVLRTGPGTNWERLTHEAFPGTKLEVIGLHNDWFKVRLGSNQMAWVHKGSVELLPEGTPLPQAHLSRIYTQPAADLTNIHVNLSEGVVAQVIPDLRTDTLKVRLFNVVMGVDYIKYDPSDKLIDQVIAAQTAEKVVDLFITLQQGRLAGYKLRQTGDGLIITMQKPLPPGLAGKRIVLDPGHGASPGAVGPEGTTEASINLAVAKKVKKMLEEAGATAIMTREKDELVHPDGGAADLYERVDIAEEQRGDLFVSIHANAAAGAYGRTAHGNETYYYYPLSRTFARIMQEELTRAIGNQPRFNAYRSYAVIRQTAMPAILVEMDFLSNPDVEEELVTDEMQDRVARGIFNGIRRSVADLAGVQAPEEEELPSYLAVMPSSTWSWESELQTAASGWGMEGFLAGKKTRFLWGLQTVDTEGTSAIDLEAAVLRPVFVELDGALKYSYSSEKSQHSTDHEAGSHELLVGAVQLTDSHRIGAYAGPVLHREDGESKTSFKVQLDGMCYPKLGQQWRLFIGARAEWTPGSSWHSLQLQTGLGWTF